MRCMVISFGAVLLIGGCQTPGPLYSQAPRNESDDKAQDLRNSLFPSDQAVLSNENVQQVLNSRLMLPARARIAVVRIGPQEWGWWTEAVAQHDESVLKSFVSALGSSARVARVTLVPSILVPPRITIPLLREMAARTQSDLVLLYQSRSRSYTRTRALSPDETKACCVVEAFLLDTRSGVIPFAAAKTETYSAKKTREDFDFEETVRKAEITAVGKALDRLAAEVVDYLDHEPTPKPDGEDK